MFVINYLKRLFDFDQLTTLARQHAYTRHLERPHVPYSTARWLVSKRNSSSRQHSPALAAKSKPPDCLLASDVTVWLSLCRDAASTFAGEKSAESCLMSSAVACAGAGQPAARLTPAKHNHLSSRLVCTLQTQRLDFIAWV